MNLLSEGIPGNHLNSVWLEGRVVENPMPIAPGEGDRWRFRLRHAESGPEEDDEYQVEAPSWAFSLVEVSELQGKAVRVIGRLHQTRERTQTPECVIFGECVEPMARPPV